mgnify:CR=1 FL=1
MLPCANAVSLAAGTRLLPAGADRDLNRNFPMGAEEAPKGELAAALWRFVADLRPTWLLDLHESVGFRRLEPKHVGNSIIYQPDAVAAACRAQRIPAGLVPQLQNLRPGIFARSA